MNHLKCSFCGCIFDAELKRCPDCGTKVKRKEANQYYTGPLDLKVAAVANSYPEKDILCSILDAEEIPYLLDFPDGGMASSSLLGEQAAVIHIMVREAELEKHRLCWQKHRIRQKRSTGIPSTSESLLTKTMNK